jgi:hypothetical protein
VQIKQRRSRAVLAFALIANAYLVAFSVDAGLSVLDEIVRHFGIGATGGALLSLIRAGVANGVVLASLAMIYVLLFVPPLPRLIFIPLIAFALWCAFGSPGFPADAFGPYHGLVQSGAQALLALAAMGILDLKAGRPFVRADTLPVKHRMVLRTAAAFVSAVIATPVAVLVLASFAYASGIERVTEGYLQFGLTALRTKETILMKGDQKAFLIATMHLGEPSFYKSMRDAMTDDSLVLEEGVTDREGKLATGLSYSGLARALGLSSQGKIESWDKDKGDVAMREAKVEPKSSGPAKPSASKTAPAPKLDIVRADIDISDFRPSTIAFLGEVAKLYASRSTEEAVARIKALGTTAPEITTAVQDDILTKRNRHLIEVFDAEASGHKSVVIPWGALHMPGIRAALIERGYVVVGDEVHTVFHYRTLLNRLLHKP